MYSITSDKENLTWAHAMHRFFAQSNGQIANNAECASKPAADMHSQSYARNAFSQPLAGNYEIDLIHNRTKRIFSDLAESCRGLRRGYRSSAASK
jgi:hypothetical protein